MDGAEIVYRMYLDKQLATAQRAADRMARRARDRPELARKARNERMRVRMVQDAIDRVDIGDAHAERINAVRERLAMDMAAGRVTAATYQAIMAALMGDGKA